MSTAKLENVELDHVFIWTEPDGGALRPYLESLGLVETYRRRHVGQGTANICYCFENAFLELVWIEDEAEAASERIARCEFVERNKVGNPFGFAWRGTLHGVQMWDFMPPYLPDDLSIKVAVDSDDISQPFMFTFPGSKPPSQWSADRKGALQRGAGFSAIQLSAVTTSKNNEQSETLSALVKALGIAHLAEGAAAAIELTLKRASNDARGDITIKLPLNS